MFYHERRLKAKGYNFIIGVDEAGRGPLAGPVVAAAVALKTSRFKNRIDDSKKLTQQQRINAFSEIVKKSTFGIGIISEGVIDRLNILVATQIAMAQAVTNLISKLKQDKKRKIHIIIDGDVKIDTDAPYLNIIKGDTKSKSIASASIIAKVTRDRIMSIYDKIYPEYGFKQHKGYPTKMHRDKLDEFGPALIHRKTFYGV